ncbi:MAG: hypothetical protein MI755_06550 [Sphingomonadales bacterium]|nr:hypothetical protein [Sphingomonadales bacterium]
MALIGCLGWGSLIWDPRCLPIRRGWYDDGPMIQVEFARQSKDGRITLVIDTSAQSIRSFWALLDRTDIEEAIEALRRREVCAKHHIGSWQSGREPPAGIIGVKNWLTARGLDAIIWTALPPGIGGNEFTPSEKEVLSYLSRLTGSKRDKAEEYIRKAPKQTDTAYRRRIEAELGWSPIE